MRVVNWTKTNHSISASNSNQHQHVCGVGKDNDKKRFDSIFEDEAPSVLRHQLKILPFFFFLVIITQEQLFRLHLFFK